MSSDYKVVINDDRNPIDTDNLMWLVDDKVDDKEMKMKKVQSPFHGDESYESPEGDEWYLVPRGDIERMRQLKEGYFKMEDCMRAAMAVIHSHKNGNGPNGPENALQSVRMILLDWV